MDWDNQGISGSSKDRLYESEGYYTVLELERLLTLNQLMDLNKLMQSPVIPHLLLIVCEDKGQLDEETRDIARTLLTQQNNIKIMFITPLGGSVSHILHNLSRRLSGNVLVRVSEELPWSDLTTSSQRKTARETSQILSL
jgi:hypothetical protein